MKIWPVQYIQDSAADYSKAVILLLLIHCLMLLPSGVCGFCAVVFGVLSSLAIIMVRKRELVALLCVVNICVLCLLITVAVAWVCYAFVHVSLFVPCGHLLGKSCPLGSRLWCMTVSLSLSHWYPGSGVVLDCIDS